MRRVNDILASNGHAGVWHSTAKDCGPRCAVRLGMKGYLGYQHWNCCYSTKLHSICKRSVLSGSLFHIAKHGGEQPVIHTLKNFPSRSQEVHDKKGDGETLMHVAAHHGWVDLLRMLVDCGADVDEQREDGWTPLHCACASGKKESQTTLAELGANPTIANDLGRMPEYYANAPLNHSGESTHSSTDMTISDSTGGTFASDSLSDDAAEVIGPDSPRELIQSSVLDTLSGVRFLDLSKVEKSDNARRGRSCAYAPRRDNAGRSARAANRVFYGHANILENEKAGVLLFARAGDEGSAYAKYRVASCLQSGIAELRRVVMDSYLEPGECKNVDDVDDVPVLSNALRDSSDISCVAGRSEGAKGTDAWNLRGEPLWWALESALLGEYNALHLLWRLYREYGDKKGEALYRYERFVREWLAERAQGAVEAAIQGVADDEDEDVLFKAADVESPPVSRTSSAPDDESASAEKPKRKRKHKRRKSGGGKKSRKRSKGSRAVDEPLSGTGVPTNAVSSDDEPAQLNVELAGESGDDGEEVLLSSTIPQDGMGPKESETEEEILRVMSDDEAEVLQEDVLVQCDDEEEDDDQDSCVPLDHTASFEQWAKEACLYEAILALMLLLGRGGPPNLTLAERLLWDASNRNGFVAQWLLANVYLSSLFRCRRREEPRVLLKRSALRGNPLAYEMLGHMYGSGSRAVHDKKSSAMFFARAAKDNVVVAQFYYGFMYERGRGMKENLVVAMYWYERAARQGMRRAQQRLCKVIMMRASENLARGAAANSLPSLMEMSGYWARKASNGDARSYFSIGQMYSSICVSMIEDWEYHAVIWFSKAKWIGHSGAEQQLLMLNVVQQGDRRSKDVMRKMLRKATFASSSGRGSRSAEMGGVSSAVMDLMYTLIMAAVCLDYPICLSYLVRKIPSVDATPTQRRILGETPLHLAAQANHVRCITILLENGADTSILDFQGRSALEMTQEDETKMLIEHGALDRIIEVLEALRGAKKNNAESQVKLQKLTSNVHNRKSLIQLLWRDAKYGTVDVHTSIPIQQLAIDKLLGHGTFAKVYSGQWKNRAVAIKMIEEENPLFDLDSFRIERAVLSLIRHPNIIPLFGAGRIPGKLSAHMPTMKGFFLVMPLCRGSLHDVLYGELLPDFDPYGAMYQIALAMQHLHEHCIIHRDLKPANILLSDAGSFLLADFGIARPDFGCTAKKTAIGTESYMAPELLSGRMDAEYTFSADVFSFGVVFWEVLERRKPSLLLSDPPLPLNTEWSNDVRQLVRDCLVIASPSKRPTFSNILQRLDAICSARMLSSERSFAPVTTIDPFLVDTSTRTDAADHDDADHLHLTTLHDLLTAEPDNKLTEIAQSVPLPLCGSLAQQLRRLANALEARQGEAVGGDDVNPTDHEP